MSYADVRREFMDRLDEVSKPWVSALVRAFRSRDRKHTRAGRHGKAFFGKNTTDAQGREHDDEGRFVGGGGADFGRQEGETAQEWLDRLQESEPEEPTHPAHVDQNPGESWDDYVDRAQALYDAWVAEYPEEQVAFDASSEQYERDTETWRQSLSEAEDAAEQAEYENEQEEIRKEHEAWKKRQDKRDAKRAALEEKLAKLQEQLDSLDGEDADDSEPEEPEEDEPGKSFLRGKGGHDVSEQPRNSDGTFAGDNYSERTRLEYDKMHADPRIDVPAERGGFSHLKDETYEEFHARMAGFYAREDELAHQEREWRKANTAANDAYRAALAQWNQDFDEREKRIKDRQSRREKLEKKMAAIEKKMEMLQKQLNLLAADASELDDEDEKDLDFDEPEDPWVTAESGKSFQRGKACCGADCEGDCDPDGDDTDARIDLAADVMLSLFGEAAVDAFPPVMPDVNRTGGKSYEPCRDDAGRFAPCGGGVGKDGIYRTGYTREERKQRSTERLAKADRMIADARKGLIDEKGMGVLGDHLLTMTRPELEKIVRERGLKVEKGKFAEAKAELVVRMGQRIRMSYDAERANVERRNADRAKASAPVTHAGPQGPSPGLEAVASQKPKEQPAPETPKPRTPKTHSVGPRSGPGGVKVGDKIEVSSRGKPAWVAKLGGRDRRFGREREFLPKTVERSGMRKQIVSYTFRIDEPGEYEVAGDEFGSFRHSFTVE